MVKVLVLYVSIFCGVLIGSRKLKLIINCCINIKLIVWLFKFSVEVKEINIGINVEVKFVVFVKFKCINILNKVINVIVVMIGKCLRFIKLNVWLFNYWVVFVLSNILLSEIFILNIIIVF